MIFTKIIRGFISVLHAKAQQEGRESIFDFYKISIAHITREYSFKKDKDNV